MWPLLLACVVVGIFITEQTLGRATLFVVVYKLAAVRPYLLAPFLRKLCCTPHTGAGLYMWGAVRSRKARAGGGGI